MTHIFKTGFGPYTYDGDTIEATRDGFRYVATVHHDSDMGPPWEEHDGHGPVSDWTRRDKRPGELLLCESRGTKRFYDFAEACRIARRDGWGYQPGKLRTALNSGRVWHAWFEGLQGSYGTSAIDGAEHEAISALYASHRATMSPREYAARAARHDFEMVKAWCNDKWHWCGIAVQVFDSQGKELGNSSVWGIEMNYPGSDNAYLLDVANETADEIRDWAVIPMLQAQATVAALRGVC